MHAGRVRWNKSEEKSKRIFGAQGKRKEKRGSANNEREIERNREKEREVEGGGVLHQRKRDTEKRIKSTLALRKKNVNNRILFLNPSSHIRIRIPSS